MTDCTPTGFRAVRFELHPGNLRKGRLIAQTAGVTPARFSHPRRASAFRPEELDRQADSGFARQFEYGVNDLARQSKVARLKFLKRGTDAFTDRYGRTSRSSRRLDRSRRPSSTARTCTSLSSCR